MKQSRNKPFVILIWAALVLTTLVAFEQVRRNGFVYDDAFVTKKTGVSGGINRESLIWAFTSTETSNWYPLTWLSHMLDCELFGLNPAGHHLTNLFFHIANSLLLFWILKRMTGAVWPSAFVAAVFALHPLRVESVAWVAERKDVLSGFFFMLTIAAYVRYAEHPGTARYLLVVLAFGLGLMSKPMLVTMPFVLLLLDYWPLGRFLWGHGKRGQALTACESTKFDYQKFSAWRLVIEKIPLLILAAASSMVAFVAQRSSGAMRPGRVLPLDFRISNALVSYVRYIGKMFYPRHLAVLYLHPYHGWPKWQVAGCLAILVVISIVAICAVRKRYLAVGWLWYVGTLVPVIGLVQVGAQSIADRYTYLPSIGINIIIAWGVAEFSTKRRYREIWLGAFAGLLLIILLLCTRMQVRYWRNELTLFGRAARVTKGNYVMHANYGVVLRRNGRLQEAIKHSAMALQISPKNYRPLNNLALSYYMLGKVDQAIFRWNKALEFNPDWVAVLNGLSWALATTDDKEFRNPVDAVKFAERACELTGYQNASVMDTLAAAYAAAGRFQEAIETAGKAVNLAASMGNEKAVEEILRRLELYKARQPYYERNIDKAGQYAEN
jgi:nicotinamide riboside transporter PnuC